MDPIGNTPTPPVQIEQAQQVNARVPVDKRSSEPVQSSEEGAKAEKLQPEGVGELVNVEA